ncbi:MAG TPA: hypothetical protein DEA90_01850 [Opitutae bacterium]|nr:hypothetical protein [Puniceicoccaceae bacterium]HBR92888.1 hypothetical protein [Opitutae bacterium]|tara:strand:- start:935 stop:1264 length:330 start_codon:yes stop_codon:yes gene_type:complete
MIKTISLLLAFVFTTACSSDPSKAREGYFTLPELIKQKGNPQLVEKNDSEELGEIYYYLDSDNQGRILMYGIKDESVIAMGYIEADADSPLMKKIAENQSDQDNPITRP